eukprot:jgi/Phyca11/133652/e_gw1.621.1.1
MEKQTQLIDELRKSRQLSELKLDGIKLPSYGGTLRESFQGRILAVLGGSLKDGAAQWYIERHCKDLPDYISKFRHLITQVKEMSELDKIMYFLRGLSSSIREEVQYRRSATLTDAITVALDYDRSHAHRGRSDNARDKPRYRSYDSKRSKNQNDGPVPMEIDNVRVPSKEECMRRNLCFRCGSAAHRARQCPMQPQQTFG